MKSISSFQITGMTLSGFKCYEEPAHLTFGNPTVVTGGNGRGKSSIADAIAFAITGLPFFGERGIDRLHCETNPNLMVELYFLDGEGQNHELTRTRQKGRMTITYDGYEIRQHDLNEMFGERDVFLSIFNPLYFIEELGDDGKKLLERYMPAISHEQVLAALSESVRASLENESILSPEAYLKRRREEIRDLEQNVIYLSGQRDLLNTQRANGTENLRALQERRDALVRERDALEEKRFAGLDLAGMREQLVDLSARYDDMAKDSARGMDTTEIDRRLQELHHKLGRRGVEQYAPKYTQHIAEASAKVKELGAKYSRELALLKGFQTGVVCPTCRRAVSESDLGAVQAGIRKSLAAITEEGRAQKSQLDELQALEKQSEETFLQFQKDDVAQISREIEELNRRRQGLEAAHTANRDRRKDELESLHSQIQAVAADIEYGNLSQEDYDRLAECRELLRECQADLDAAKKAALEKPEDYDAKIAQVESLILDQKKLLADAILYVGKRAELTFSQLKMNLVEIALHEVVKSTGEVKDVFKFTYGGRYYNRLSLSEKIRAGLEVSELVKRLTGRNYPVFIDNMESVDELTNVRPTGQIIMAKCVRGAALTVKPMGRPQVQRAA